MKKIKKVKNAIGLVGQVQQDMSASDVNAPSVNVINELVNYFDGSLEQGTFNPASGVINTSDTRIRTKNFMKLKKGTYNINYAGLDQIVIYVYDLLGNYIQSESNAVWIVGATNKVLNEERLVKLAFSKTDNSNISPSELLYLEVKRIG